MEVAHANLTLASSVGRHALRLAATLALAVALYRIFDLPRGYWVPLTVLMVLRPDFASTLRRGIQRYAGTLLGAVVATALTATLEPGQWTLAVFVGLGSAAMFATLFANYGAFTVAITATIVFFFALGGLDEWSGVLDRLLDTGIGGALALSAYALYPTWEGDRVRPRIADLIEAVGRYATAVLGACADPSSRALESLVRQRLACRRARTEAEASIQLALDEPARHRRDVDAVLDELASLRRIANGTLALEVALEDGSARTPHESVKPLSRGIGGALTNLAAAARYGGTLAPLPPLRAMHTALAKAEGDDSLLVQATDGMVDAVNSLGHLIG